MLCISASLWPCSCLDRSVQLPWRWDSWHWSLAVSPGDWSLADWSLAVGPVDWLLAVGPVDWSLAVDPVEWSLVDWSLAVGPVDWSLAVDHVDWSLAVDPVEWSLAVGPVDCRNPWAFSVAQQLSYLQRWRKSIMIKHCRQAERAQRTHILLCSPATPLGFTIWVTFLHMGPFLNPTIETVTFRLHGWCMLGVFLLLAFTRLGHERQDL